MSDAKPIYKPLKKSYSEDINDLVEDELNKGGVGSGVRGHKTLKDYSVENKESNHPDTLRKLIAHHKAQHVAHEKAGNKDKADYYKAKHQELSLKLADLSHAHIKNRK